MNLRELKKEEKDYTYTSSPEVLQKTGCIGHLRGDFGSSGIELYSNWFEHNPELKTQEFSKDIDKVINNLRFGKEYGKMMGDRDSMAKYCYSHPESMFAGNYTREFGFRADTEKYSFLFRLNLNRGDYNFYCYCYEKEALDKHLENAEKLVEKAEFLNKFYTTQRSNTKVTVSCEQLVVKDDDKKFVNLSDLKGITLVDLNKASVDFMGIENRRFMYHPSGMLVLGAEDTCLGENFSSHSEEFYEVCKMHEHELPPFDDFIRGWIGVGGAYNNGIIHFAPNIISNNMEMFEKAFSFVEAALENGFSKDTCLRGFGNKWEQKISEALGEEGRRENKNSLQESINSAKEKSFKTTTKSSKPLELEY